MPTPRYATAADVIARGGAGTEAQINTRLLIWEAIIDRLTRNTFSVLNPGELIFDGNNSKILHFNLPLVEVTAVKINDGDTALDATEYRAFTGIALPQDNRGNPKIELRLTKQPSLFACNSFSVFARGYDQKITAKWGYVDPGDTLGTYVTPAAINDAAIRLVLLDLDGFFAGGGGGPAGLPVTPVKRERTDDHEVEYMELEDVKALWTLIPRDIYELLSMYRGPLRISNPDPRILLSPTSHAVLAY